MNQNPFYYLDKSNTGIPAGSSAWDGFLRICNDYFSLIATCSIVACLLTVMFLLFKVLIARKANKKSELKDMLTTKIILMFIISFAPLIISTVVKIAQMF